MSHISLSDARFFVLCFTLVVYGVFGSPTPDNPSVIELIIGAGLVLSVGLTALPLLFYKPDTSCRWLRLLFFYGISVVLLNGILSAHDPLLMIRDIIPFLFLCLPLFFRAQIEQSEKRTKIFLGVCFFLALCFAARVLAPFYGVLPLETELLYLANSPVLIFVSIVLIGFAFIYLSQNLSACTIGLSAICFVLGTICLWSMFFDAQRATFGAVVLSILTLLLVLFIKSPRRILLPVILCIMTGFLFMEFFEDMLTVFSQKTALVGFNSRVEDVRAVLMSASDSPLSVLIGQGWGATYASPAVGMMDVAYTHSFLTYSFLKGGLAMTLLSLTVLVSALLRIRNIWLRGEYVFALGLFWALMIPYFLYASHKSLDFGVILLLIYILGTRHKALQ